MTEQQPHPTDHQTPSGDALSAPRRSDDRSSANDPAPTADLAAPDDVASTRPSEAPRADERPADAANAANATGAADAGDVVSEDQVKAVLRRVKDPELNLNIVDLGLVYGVAVAGSVVKVDMSLTSPGCPSGPEIMGEAEQQLRSIPGVTDVAMNLVWSPIWTPERIEPRVRAYLGF